jgi:hypothetical protein
MLLTLLCKLAPVPAWSELNIVPPPVFFDCLVRNNGA